MTGKGISVQEMVEALLLFNEPILNHRYHELIAREAESISGEDLQGLAARIVEAERAARDAARQWQGEAHGPELAQPFLAHGRGVLLEAFLDLADSQTRLFSFMARQAPLRNVRAGFEQAAEDTRHVAAVLRRAAEDAAEEAVGWNEQRDVGELRNVQEEDTREGDLRGQVEQALHRTRAAGKEPRRLLLSHTALRHLRDQGCFQNGKSTLHGVRVDVDLGWDAPAFALETYDVVPLEEMMVHGVDGPIPNPFSSG
ncbi:MAG TPA: hypothetical protein VNZ52_07310 [Candidatus Thermoplasmatota archaeon]|nr:hypothetical protein [Candidatus Thermoplasmatota archaeon]